MTFAQPQVQIRPICSNVMNYSPRSTPLLFSTSHECLGLVCARALCRTRALSEQKQLANLHQNGAVRITTSALSKVCRRVDWQQHAPLPHS